MKCCPNVCERYDGNSLEPDLYRCFLTLCCFLWLYVQWQWLYQARQWKRWRSDAGATFLHCTVQQCPYTGCAILHLSAKSTLQEDPVGVKHSMEASLWLEINSQYLHSEQIIPICCELGWCSDSLQADPEAVKLTLT